MPYVHMCDIQCWGVGGTLGTQTSTNSALFARLVFDIDLGLPNLQSSIALAIPSTLALAFISAHAPLKLSPCACLKNQHFLLLASINMDVI